MLPTLRDMRVQLGTHQGAALAIVLGLFLDTVPEAVLVAADGRAGEGMNLALIGGLMLANFPEAWTNAASMRQQGYSALRILLVWIGVMLSVALLAGLAALALPFLGRSLFALAEGLAVGALVTMVVDTLLPEAYLRGSGIFGLSTLLGVVTAFLLAAAGAA